MKLAIDLGRHSVKAICNGEQLIFPSVVGEGKTFTDLSDSNHFSIETLGKTWLIGESALRQSTLSIHDQDKKWIESDHFLVLILAAITKFASDQVVNVELVTGLPHSDYRHLREKIERHLMGQYQVGNQTITIQKPIILSQAFGNLMDYGMEDDGKFNGNLDNKQLGLINVGSHTVEFMTIVTRSDGSIEIIENSTTSLPDGMWTAVSVLGQRLEQELQVSYSPFELDEVMRTGQAKYYGRKDVSRITIEVQNDYFESLLAECKRLWSDQATYSASRLDFVLCVGGKGLEFGEFLKTKGFHPHIVIPAEGVWSTVRGYAKYQARKEWNGK